MNDWLSQYYENINAAAYETGAYQEPLYVEGFPKCSLCDLGCKGVLGAHSSIHVWSILDIVAWSCQVSDKDVSSLFFYEMVRDEHFF